VLETAKATASIDLYSKGRLILGVGAGWFREEAQVMGVDFARRWQHLRESVEALRVLWSGDDEGEIVKFPPVKLGPKPVQKPGPPILLGAHDPRYALKRSCALSRWMVPGRAQRRRARECILQIKNMAREFGRDPNKLEFSVLLRGGDGPTDVMKQYKEAGVSRLVVAASAVSDDGVKVVRGLGSIVERAAKL
jgi:alkanesulfonate monooxygenase SsuD/methylene tetrahydromethanopterin reductase-like flavin-dependent oxidoreductase (luciferase family)